MSVNKVILLGRLGADPEIKYTQNQLAICQMRLATNDRRKNADGEWTEETEWHRVTVFGKTAENCAQYLKKGREAFIEGKIRTNKWQDKEGNDRYTTEVLANNVTFVGGGKGASYDSPNQGNSQSFGGNAPSKSPSAPVTSGGVESVPFDDDDIPF